MRSHEVPGTLCTKMVYRLTTELRIPCPIPEDMHLLTLQQSLAVVVWPSSRLAHSAGSCAAVMPQPLALYLHTDNETPHDLLCLQSMIVSGAVSRSVKFTGTGFANRIPQKVMWDKGCWSLFESKHPWAFWSWDFSVVSTIRKDLISLVQKDKWSI